MHNTIRIHPLLLAALLICSAMTCLVSCGNTDGATYTLNEYLDTAPHSWNPHTSMTDADTYIPGYTEMGLVDITVGKDGVSPAWVFEMAENVQDITAKFPDSEKWGIGEDIGRVYKITLNPQATWENGKTINADTYIYSMHALLDPRMQNCRAEMYTDGSTAILNADLYLNASLPIYKTVVPAYGEDQTPDYSFDTETTMVYMHLTSYEMTFSSVCSIADLYSMGYVDAADYAVLLENRNVFGYVEINDTTRDAAISVAQQVVASFGLTYSEERFMEMLFYDTGERTESYSFENVGLFKSGEYELIYITKEQTGFDRFLTSLTKNWIVYEDLYEAGKTVSNGTVTTNYGTSTDTYISYGPYKLVSAEKDRQIILTKNGEWYGYTDGKHRNQYMTTDIRCDILSDPSEAIRLFLEGKLDIVRLTRGDLDTFRESPYLLSADTAYTFRYIFATDPDKLASLVNGEGDNKTVLAYDDFRKALSLALDRTALAEEATDGGKPAYGLFNDRYVFGTPEEPFTIYRDTDAGKQAILDLYGMEYSADNAYADLDTAYDSVTGYDVAAANALFASVYEQATANGNYTDGQTVTIHCMVSADSELTETDRKQEALLNRFITEATDGTGFAGKISFKFLCGAADRYSDVANGRIEMIRGAWGGALLYPVSAIRCYTDPSYGGTSIDESCGWNPAAEKLTLTIDADGNSEVETVEDTLQNWSRRIDGGILTEDGTVIAPSITDPDTRLSVFSALENAVLSSYQCIPFASETVYYLHSAKTEYPVKTHSTVYGFGGVRLLSYNYDDAAWNAYVRESGGTFDYQ